MLPPLQAPDPNLILRATGHMSKDCPQPRQFTGTCRSCNEEGKFSSRLRTPFPARF